MEMMFGWLIIHRFQVPTVDFDPLLIARPVPCILVAFHEMSFLGGFLVFEWSVALEHYGGSNFPRIEEGISTCLGGTARREHPDPA
jgi:hypothetical protein